MLAKRLTGSKGSNARTAGLPRTTVRRSCNDCGAEHDGDDRALLSEHTVFGCKAFWCTLRATRQQSPAHKWRE